jgi:hypothetical protein
MRVVGIEKRTSVRPEVSSCAVRRIEQRTSVRPELSVCAVRRIGQRTFVRPELSVSASSIPLRGPSCRCAL